MNIIIITTATATYTTITMTTAIVMMKMMVVVMVFTVAVAVETWAHFLSHHVSMSHVVAFPSTESCTYSISDRKVTHTLHQYGWIQPTIATIHVGMGYFLLVFND